MLGAGVTIFELNRALLVAFRSGDREALTEVYWAYVEAVERILRLGFSTAEYRVPGLSDADTADAVQETFARAFSPRARDAYDGLRPFRPYVLRIARNLLVDRARRAGRVAPGATIDVDAVVADDDTPEEVLLAAALRDATRDFLAGLDPQARRFVQLRFEEQRAQQDVATALSITRRRVRTLETHLRRALAEHLRAAGLSLDAAFEEEHDTERPKGGARP